MTGLPDFGEIRITYVPDASLCRAEVAQVLHGGVPPPRAIFYEQVTNQILDDLVELLQPRRMTVVGDFSVRGRDQDAGEGRVTPGPGARSRG